MRADVLHDADGSVLPLLRSSSGTPQTDTTRPGMLTNAMPENPDQDPLAYDFFRFVS